MTNSETLLRFTRAIVLPGLLLLSGCAGDPLKDTNPFNAAGPGWSGPSGVNTLGSGGGPGGHGGGGGTGGGHR